MNKVDLKWVFQLILNVLQHHWLALLYYESLFCRHSR